MSVRIKKVSGRKELRDFIRFPETLYKENPYYTPPLVIGEINTLDARQNPASEFCDFSLFLAYKDGVIAGRVAAIVNHLANSQWGHKEVRFGWMDFIDDKEVSAALIREVEEFGRSKGMDTIVGPLGFTDFDPEGLLVEGFDRESTMALRYNFPYYKDHIEALGFAKDVDWVECRIFSDKTPDKMFRFSKIAAERSRVHLRIMTRRIARKENYALKVFKLINLCYKDLYDYTVMPEYMSDKYLGFYMNFLDVTNNLAFVENENGELVAFGLSMPSLAKALRKCRGRLLPFGWWHILKAMRGKCNDGVELLLVGVHPDYRNTGINSLVFAKLFRTFIDNGVTWAETNAILETNVQNLRQWDGFAKECVKRRRAYKKPLLAI